MTSNNASRRKRNATIRGSCDFTSADMQNAHRAIDEEERNLVFGEPAKSAQKMAEKLLTYFARIRDGEDVPPVEQLKKLKMILLEAITLVSTGQAKEMIRVTTLLPRAMARHLNGDDVAMWSRDPEFHAYLLEVMWTLVTLAVVMLANQVETFPVENLSNRRMSLPNVTLNKVLEALSAVFDSRNHYYKLRKENDTRREALVCSWRLESALQTPGFFVRVSGVVNGQTHYFCSENGVKHDGDACECCTPPPEADAVLVILSRLLAKSTSGSGSEYMLRFLLPPRQISMASAELLLRLFVQFLGTCSVGSTTSKMLMQHVEVSSTVDFQTLCVKLCSKMAKYMQSNLLWLKCETMYKDDLAIPNAVGHLVTISSWCILHYRRVELKLVKESLSELQKKMWDMLLDAELMHMARMSMSAAMKANSFLPDSEGVMLDRNWTERRNVISRILKHPTEMGGSRKVIEFVTMIGEKGLALPEADFLEIFFASLQSSMSHHTAVKAEDQKLAAMLGCLDLSGYSNVFLDTALEWLELERHRAPKMDGEKVLSILSKLLACDKDNSLEKKFLDVLWKHAANIPDRAFVSCLIRKIAEHYTSKEVVEDLKTLLKTSEDQKKLLQHCSDVMSTGDSKSFTSSMAGALIASKGYGQKTETWKEKEINLQLNSSSKLSNVLETSFPLICSQTGKVCLDRVVFAQRFVDNLSTDGASMSFGSTVTSAMALEFQTLVAPQKETVLHSQLLRQVEELSEKHLQAYDVMKRVEHEKPLKFFENCQKEKESAVRDALYEKEKFMASVRKAGVSSGARLTFEDIPAILLKAAGAALHEVKGKHKESLERLPNSECAVCFLEFSLKRKRACLNPCGHTSACVTCATREWKRTKTCPMCKSSIGKPVSVSSKLFF